MLRWPYYQLGLLFLTVLAATGGLWLLVAPPSPPGIEITLADPPSSPLLQSPPASPSTQELINLNTAAIDELRALPKIDLVLAQRIVAYREQYGPFQRTDQVMLVERIGPATYDAIRALVTVEE